MSLRALLLLSALTGLFVPEAKAKEDKVPFLQLIPRLEFGFAAVLAHQYQVGTNGSRFNFLTQGGEDTLYFHQRYSADLVFVGRHFVTALYQPFTLPSVTVANRNNTNGGSPIVIDDAVFQPGTPMNIVYGFDFWRVSYLYSFTPAPRTDILGAGVSLQLRNAAISFTSANGNVRSVQQNIGPVPTIKIRIAHWFSRRFGLDFEADGLYASSAILNGATKAFTGWIWDAALTVKTHVWDDATAFAVVRSFGGGAQGNNAYPAVSSTTSVNPYTYDNLATLELAIGASLE